jgi:hypothetical protein
MYKDSQKVNQACANDIERPRELYLMFGKIGMNIIPLVGQSQSFQ